MSKIKCDKCNGTGWIEVEDIPGPTDAPADWDGAAYLYLFPDVKNAGVDPLEHWLSYGEKEGRVWKPAGWSSAGYLNKWPDIAANAYYSLHPLHHYWRHGKGEGRTWGGSVNPDPWPAPGPGPSPATGVIKSFKEVTVLRDSEQAYFSSANIDGVLHLGTYGSQNGILNSKLYKVVGGQRVFVQQFNCESIFDLLNFNGCWLMSQEGGLADTVNKAMIYKRQSNEQWTEIYRHSTWDLMLHMTTDASYAYAVGAVYSGGGGVLRSSDGINWSTYFDTVKAPNIPFAVCTDGDVWTVGGMYEDRDSHPFLYKNTTRVWTGDGKGMASAVISYKGYIYFSIQLSAGAELWRYRKSDGSCSRVKTFTGLKDFFQMFIDDNILYVFPGPRTGTGAQCWQTDGTDWSQISGVSGVPWITMGTAVVNGVRYLPGGQFAQDSSGFGKVYEAVKG